MVHSAAIAPDCAETQSLSDPVLKVRTDRDRLTRLLRRLAADLDDLDRRLSDLAWRRLRQTALVPDGELMALQSRRASLDTRLSVLAGQLRDLDAAHDAYRDDRQWPQARVGTCPDCGYPSLESRLCATCRRYPAGPNPLDGLFSR